MDKLEAQIRGQVIRSMFKPVLEKLENDPFTQILNKRTEECEKVCKGSMNPDVILLLSIAKEQISMRENLKKLVQDIMNLDWEKEETDLQFKSMKICFDKMSERNTELRTMTAWMMGRQ